MNIAIIGTGNVGRALAGSSVEAGHIVTLSSTEFGDAETVARQTGARAAASNREAAQAGEIVILAVPYHALTGLLDELGDALDGKVVVDVTNRTNAEDPAMCLDGTSASEQIQDQVPGAQVVKAFNTALAARQADPMVEGIPLDGFVAGDDHSAKATVLELAESIGFRPIDAGPLAMARALEAMALINIMLNIRNEWPWQTGWKLVGPTAAA